VSFDQRGVPESAGWPPEGDASGKHVQCF